MAAKDVSKQWSCDRCREGCFTAVSRCSLFTQLSKSPQIRVGGGGGGCAETLVGNLTLLLKCVCCSGCYSSLNNIILTNIDHAWKVLLTSFIFYRDILESHEEYTIVKSLPSHGSNCVNIQLKHIFQNPHVFSFFIALSVWHCYS